MIGSHSVFLQKLEDKVYYENRTNANNKRRFTDENNPDSVTVSKKPRTEATNKVLSYTVLHSKC